MGWLKIFMMNSELKVYDTTAILKFMTINKILSIINRYNEGFFKVVSSFYEIFKCC